MKIYKYLCAAAAFIIIMLEPFAVNAARYDFFSDIDDTEKSLTIHFYVQSTGVEVPIPGAEIAVYKVAELVCEKGEVRYELLPDYDSLRNIENGKDVTFDGLSGTDSQKLAIDLEVYVNNPDAVGVTDITGNCLFENIPQGMYLVRELNADDKAADCKYFSSYLVSVPLPVTYESGNFWKYDVISEPKTVVENIKHSTNTDKQNSDTDTDSEDSPKTASETLSVSYSVNTNTPSVVTTQSYDNSPVITGYISKILVILMIFFASGFVIAANVGSKSKEDKNEKV